MQSDGEHDMKLGLFTAANTRSGLGLVCRDLVRHCPVDSLFALPTKHFPVEMFCDRQMTALSNCPDRQHATTYLDKFRPDVLLTVEVPYDNVIFDYCRERGVRTAQLVMAEVYNPALTPDLFICPTQHCYDKVKAANKILWRLPVGLSEFRYRQRRGRARTFTHIHSFDRENRRRQTDEVIQGFAMVPGNQRLIIHYQTMTLTTHYTPDNCPDSRVEWRCGVTNPADLYAEADVLIASEAYAGFGRCAVEAMSCGLPVITTDAQPMNEIVTGWLVPVVDRVRVTYGVFNTTVNKVSPNGIAGAVLDAQADDLNEWSAIARQTALMHKWTQKRTRELMKILSRL
jgi:glycosyltransferase involved in cell wall biosynthesis